MKACNAAQEETKRLEISKQQVKADEGIITEEQVKRLLPTNKVGSLLYKPFYTNPHIQSRELSA